MTAKLETPLKDQLSVGFESFDLTFISIESVPEGTEFSIAAPCITTEPLYVIVFDKDNNLARWNQGRLY